VCVCLGSGLTLSTSYLSVVHSAVMLVPVLKLRLCVCVCVCVCVSGTSFVFSCRQTLPLAGRHQLFLVSAAVSLCSEVSLVFQSADVH